MTTTEGEISGADLFELFVRLWKERFTGALRFEQDGLIKIIYFKEGDLLSASTNDRSDSISEIFLRAEKLTREHLKQAMAKRKENESLAEVLLSLGFISRTELTWARKAQLVGVIKSVIDWPSGNYTIVRDYLPKREEGPAFPFAPALLQIILMEQDRTRSEKALDQGALILERSPDFEKLYSRLDLDDEAGRVTELVNGQRTVAEIAAESSADSANVFRLLYGLMLLGILKPEQELQVIPEVSAHEEDPFGDSFAPATELTLSPEVETIEDSEVAATESTRRSSRVPLFLFLLLVTILGVAGTFGWRYMDRKQNKTATTDTAVIAQATPTPLLVEEDFAVNSSANPLLTATPSPSMAPASSPTGSPGTSVPLSTAGPIPTLAATPRATARSTPSATPAAAITIIRPPARPTSSPAGVSSNKKATSASQNLPAGGYTIQFAILCEEASVSRLRTEHGDRVWFAPIRFRERDCYRAHWGRFGDRARADAALSNLPADLRQGGTPAVVSITKE